MATQLFMKKVKQATIWC